MTNQSEKKNAEFGEDSRLDQVAEFVGTIARLMSASNMHKFDFKDGDFEISLRRDGNGSPNQSSASAQPSSVIQAEQDPSAAASEQDIQTIKAPMIGTFYEAPAPGEAPYVATGDNIQEGDVVGIIEAMKIMNEIAADCSGEIVEIIAENGQTVEFGSPLMRVRRAT